MDNLKTIDELNLIDWPLTIFDPEIDFKETALREYRILMRSKASGNQIDGYLKIYTINDSNSSILQFYDEDVLLGLYQLMTAKYNNSNHLVIDSLTEFCKILGWSKGKYNNDKVISAIKRLTGLLLETNRWWDNKERMYFTRGFHIIDKYDIIYTKKGVSRINIYWSAEILNSFKSKNVRPINFTQYLTIKQPGARKLFRILDKRLYIKTKEKIPFEYLARVMLGIPQTKSSNYCEKLVRKYADELVAKKYLLRYKIEIYKNKYVFMFRKKLD